MGKYRVLTGDHAVTDVRRNESGAVVSESTRIVEAGSVIDSDEDLCALFNCIGVRPKFEQLHEAATVAGHVWNPKHESIDQFVERMRGSRAPAVEMPLSQAPPSPSLSQERAPAAPRQPAYAPAPGHADLGGSTVAEAARLTESQLQVMTPDQLRAHCETEEIPFDAGDSRDKLVQIVRAFQGG